MLDERDERQTDRQTEFATYGLNRPRGRLRGNTKYNISGLLILKIQKSLIRETPTLSTDADVRTDTILDKLRDLSLYIKKQD